MKIVVLTVLIILIDHRIASAQTVFSFSDGIMKSDGFRGGISPSIKMSVMPTRKSRTQTGVEIGYSISPTAVFRPPPERRYLGGPCYSRRESRERLLNLSVIWVQSPAEQGFKPYGLADLGIQLLTGVRL